MRSFRSQLRAGCAILGAGVFAVLCGLGAVARAGQDQDHDHGDHGSGDHGSDGRDDIGSASASAAEPDGLPAELGAVLAAQLDVLTRTQTTLVAKHGAKQRELGSRVRAAYKLLRTAQAPIWSQSEAVMTLAERRAAVRRILGRDKAELVALASEVEQVGQALTRIESEREAAGTMALPAPGSLLLPVAGARVVGEFGTYRHVPSRALLSRRGIELRARAGRNVRAPADGHIRYAGPARGLGRAVIIDHGDFISILGRINERPTAAGRRVSGGDVLGEASGDRVYMEIRLDLGAGGYPIDPKPLISWH